MKEFFFANEKMKRRWKRKIKFGEGKFFSGEQNLEKKLRNKFGEGTYIILQGRRLKVEEKEENIW